MPIRRLFLLASIIAAVFSARITAQGPPPRSAYQSTCGSEISWLESFDDAAKKAQETGKPILWYCPKTLGSTMDRSQELHWFMMGGMFFDAGVVAMINAHFVPLKLGYGQWMPDVKGRRRGRRGEAGSSDDLFKKYGLVHMKFIEPGFVLLDKDANLVHAMDRLTTFQSKWFLARMKDVFKAFPVLGKFDETAVPPAPTPELAAARKLLADGNAADAKTAYRTCVDKGGAEAAEALYFVGVCAHMTQKTSEGDAAWKELIAKSAQNRWAAKAKLELDRWGPFMRGFEEYRDYPEKAFNAKILTGTTMEIGATDIPDATKRAVAILLSLQRQNGSWDDSWYDFGGLDSMPNVYVAVTALVAWALLEWRDVAPEAIDAALKKAVAYLKDEAHTAPDDKDELIWAHTYRILFLKRLIESRPEMADGAQKKIKEIVEKIEAFQQKTGDWRHEYPNPFATATTLHALAVAKGAGIAVDAEKLKSGAEALDRCRAEDGTFTYGSQKRKASPSAPEGAGGRSALCELALLLNGKSSQEKLAASLKMGFDNHSYLEAVRKYDNHSDQYANGGFFFWYDMLGRSQAIDAVTGPEKSRYKSQMRDMVLKIHEVDGAWIDSHELGKSYGTAMGLIVLKQNLEAKQ